MTEYQTLGHMSIVNDSERENCVLGDRYFIPHHGVLKDGKLKVVFNASARIKPNSSLNDCLYTGQSLQTSIVMLIIRWRLYHYAYSTDIEKMYRQINIHPKDRKFQQIIWRNNSREKFLNFVRLLMV